MVLCKFQLSVGYLKQWVNPLMESQDTHYPKYRVISAAQNQLAVGTVWLLPEIAATTSMSTSSWLTRCSVEIMDVGVWFGWGERDEEKFPSLFLTALYLFECSCLLNLEYVEITNNHVF